MEVAAVVTDIGGCDGNDVAFDITFDSIGGDTFIASAANDANGSFAGGG